MCDEHVDHSQITKKLARTWKSCTECHGLIAPGDKYVRIFVVNDGRVSTYNNHVCDDIAAEATDDGEGCRMLSGEAAYVLIENGDHAARKMIALLNWMNIHSRLRYAKMLAHALGYT